MRTRRAAAALAILIPAACSREPSAPSPTPSQAPAIGRADIGGSELAYACRGEGEPTVVLEGGLGAAGTQEFFSFVDRVSPVTRVCTYDRAGTGSSDPRPDDAGPVTAGLMASEIHALLDAISVDAPVVIAAHSYGGMPARAFAGTYPGEVAGLVLIDVSSEPEIPLYRRLHAGPWIDHDDRIDIGTTVKELSAAGGLDDLPLVVVTAELIEDRWLATEATLAARAQTRLAGLSSNRIHVVATGSGHLVHDDVPDVVATAIRAVIEAARSGSPLPDCREAFGDLAVTCVRPGEVPSLTPA